MTDLETVCASIRNDLGGRGEELDHLTAPAAGLFLGYQGYRRCAQAEIAPPIDAQLAYAKATYAYRDEIERLDPPVPPDSLLAHILRVALELADGCVFVLSSRNPDQ